VTSACRIAVRRTAARTARNNRLVAAFAALGAVALLAASRIHVNGSWSDEAWGYFVVPMGTPGLGDRVVFAPPEAVAAAAPYLKSVAGVPGDRIHLDENRGVWVDDRFIGRAKPTSLDGRALEPVASGRVPEGHFFVFADHPDSHDSRYAEIGLVPRDRIRGRAVALPDLPWLGLEGPLVNAPPGTASTP